MNDTRITSVWMVGSCEPVLTMPGDLALVIGLIRMAMDILSRAVFSPEEPKASAESLRLALLSADAFIRMAMRCLKHESDQGGGAVG